MGGNPFAIVGIDFAGPFLMSDNTVVMVHCPHRSFLLRSCSYLELAPDMSAPVFPLANDCVISPREISSVVHSYKARNFLHRALFFSAVTPQNAQVVTINSEFDERSALTAHPDGEDGGKEW